MKRTLLPLLVVISVALACRWTTSQNSTAPISSPAPTTASASELPRISSPVNDLANVLSPEAEDRLQRQLATLESKRNLEFAVLTVPTTNGQQIFEYSLTVAKGWEKGSTDRRALLVIAVTDRQWHVQVSEALQKELSNDFLKELGNLSVSFYKQGDYEMGIAKLLTGVEEKLKSQQSTPK
jgi:uncharacterized protein